MIYLDRPTGLDQFLEFLSRGLEHGEGSDRSTLVCVERGGVVAFDPGLTLARFEEADVQSSWSRP
jgi:hypothetical protein